MTKLEEILEALRGLQADVDKLLAAAERVGGSVALPAPEPEPVEIVPLIVDALSIIKAEEAAAQAEKLAAVRKRRMLDMPEDGHMPTAHGL